jgi:SPP1 family predicted phage head-tail adaptor
VYRKPKPAQSISINPGELRHLISIEQKTETRSPSGAITNDWTEFASVRAKVEPTTGRELFAGMEFAAQSDHIVTIRYLPGLTTAMRINFNGRYLDILNLSDIEERHRVIIMNCLEGRSPGNQ